MVQAQGVPSLIVDTVDHTWPRNTNMQYMQLNRILLGNSVNNLQTLRIIII